MRVFQGGILQTAGSGTSAMVLGEGDFWAGETRAPPLFIPICTSLLQKKAALREGDRS
jgi:hypothetical protein